MRGPVWGLVAFCVSVEGAASLYRFPQPSQKLACLHAARPHVGAVGRVTPTLCASGEGGSDGSGGQLLGILMAAARNEELAVLQGAFDSIPHSTMLQIHQMAAADVSEALWLVSSMDQLMQLRLTAGATKLRELLQAGEINQMDAALIKLVRSGGADTGFDLVLTSNIEHARTSGDETMLQLYVHIYTRMQEELEKQASPAAGLLHRLLRTDDIELRERILVDFLVPKTTVSLPGGQTLALETATPPKVSPREFGAAVRDAVAALRGIELATSGPDGNKTLSDSVEDCRQVAKQAREVLATRWAEDEVELADFSRMLGPVFAPRQAKPTSA